MLLCGQLCAKVRILTFHYNKPQFIEFQYNTYKKFLEDEFELIVFNDAAKEEDEKAIGEMCDKYGIQCVRFKPEWHVTDPLNEYMQNCLNNPSVYSHIHFKEPLCNSPSVRHCHVIQYALDHYGYNHDDIVVVADGDAFLIRPLSLKTFMGTSDITGIRRWIAEEDVDYLWVVFIAFDPKKIPHLHELRFHLDVINGKLHDSGAHFYHYLKTHPHLKVKKYLGQASTGFYHWNDSQLRQYGFNKEEAWLIKNLPWPQCVEFHIDKHILHFGASSFEVEGGLVKEEYVSAFIHNLLDK